MDYKKSQSAIEFIILLSVAVFFLTLFLLSLNEGMSEKIREKRNLAIKNVALSVQDEINLALKSGDGYYREFAIPENVYGVGYDINITEEMIYVKSFDNKNSLSLPIHNVTGKIIKGKNAIQKKEGIIYIN